MAREWKPRDFDWLWEPSYLSSELAGSKRLNESHLTQIGAFRPIAGGGELRRLAVR